MAERFTYSQERGDSASLRKTLENVSSLPEFRAVLLETLPHIQVEHFLYDFESQNTLRELFGMYAHKTRSGYDAKEIPVVILKRKEQTHAGRETFGGTNLIEPQRFTLDDPDHIYYFNQVPQGNPQTIATSSEEHTVDPLNRVAVQGGSAQAYDYTRKEWTENNQGLFRGVGIGNGRIGGVRLQRLYGSRPTSQQ